MKLWQSEKLKYQTSCQRSNYQRERLGKLTFLALFRANRGIVACCYFSGDVEDLSHSWKYGDINLRIN